MAVWLCVSVCLLCLLLLLCGCMIGSWLGLGMDGSGCGCDVAVAVWFAVDTDWCCVRDIGGLRTRYGREAGDGVADSVERVELGLRGRACVYDRQRVERLSAGRDGGHACDLHVQ